MTVPSTQIDTNPAPVNPAVDPEVGLSPGEVIVPASQVNTSAAPVGSGTITRDDEGNLLPGYGLDQNGNTVFVGADYVAPDTQALADQGYAAATQAGKINAQKQQTNAVQLNQSNNTDWRFRLSLAPRATYLYKDRANELLRPLAVTNGVVFPYTPTVSTNYRAVFNPQDMTHSNLRNYFYQSSYVDTVQINGQFTAQDTNEANYLLAVIHFFRSVTKMFYGQDTQRGSPPPLVFLSGLGDYQFSKHPCVVTNFTYNLPADVDYIRAGTVGQVGLNLVSTRDQQSNVATNAIFGAAQRLAAAFAPAGGMPQVPTQRYGVGVVNNPTYVPTKMEIQISLLPIQSRNQVSNQFSVKEFANGNLLKGGFW